MGFSINWQKGGMIAADGDESDKHLEVSMRSYPYMCSWIKIFKLVAKHVIQFIPNESQKGWIFDVENKRQYAHKCS